MIRNSLILVASSGRLAGCAGSSASTQSPDAGNVKYDVGQPGGAGAGATNPDAPVSGDADGGSAPKVPKGRDSTTTKSVGVTPKAVKKIASAKPPKPEEPAADPKKKPTRKRRVDPMGLLAEAFTIEATTTKLPDFAALTASALFIAPMIDGATTKPIAGAPSTLKAPVALRFTGSLNVTAADEYRLCTTSSDGSQLMIEDTLVVDNDGVHAEAVEVCELVNLEPGEYKIEVRSFHVTGPVVITASWATGATGVPSAIPARNFYKPEGADDRVKAKK